MEMQFLCHLKIMAQYFVREEMMHAKDIFAFLAKLRVVSPSLACPIKSIR